MLAQVRAEGMHAVTWDTSAEDWSERNGKIVADRIVDRARPGSIILLHDGLDGNVHADRSVLLTASGGARLGTSLPGGRRTVTRNAAMGMAARSMNTSTMRVRLRYTGTGTSTSLRTR